MRHNQSHVQGIPRSIVDGKGIKGEMRKWRENHQRNM